MKNNKSFSFAFGMFTDCGFKLEKATVVGYEYISLFETKEYYYEDYIYSTIFTIGLEVRWRFSYLKILKSK